MRLYWVALGAILLAGHVHADTSTTHPPVTVEAGADLFLQLQTLAAVLERCYVVTPQEVEVEFIREEPTDARFELRPSNSLTSCNVAVHNVGAQDHGVWEIHSVSDTGSRLSRSFHVTVNVPDVSKEVEDNVTWLNAIDFASREGSIISISLSKFDHHEECYLRAPNGQVSRVSDSGVAGVTAQSSSELVSCRILIGPMTENLAGTWTLCGVYKEDQLEHERCQPANIAWNNNNRWESTTHPKFNHVVHFGGTVAPAVRGTGTVTTCHIVTPNGEDIVITPESEYTNLSRTVLNDASICSVAIGPIDASALGDWEIYGVFHSIVNGFNVVRLPMHLFLYDINNPYDQAYNVTKLDPSNHVVNLGNTIELEVVGAGATDDCHLNSPSGQAYDASTYASSENVRFLDVGSRAACHISVGPIDEQMLGEWQLIGKFSNNGLFSEFRHVFHIYQEDPENPKEDETRTIVNVTAQYFDTSIGASHRVTISSDPFTNGESCHIRTPDGFQYKIMEGFNVRGIEVIEDSNIACGVTVNLVSEDLIGDWMLISRESRLNNPIERRLLFTIYVEEFVNALPQEAIVAEGNDFYMRLENSTELYSTCKLKGPDNDGLYLYEEDQTFVQSCGFIVKNLRIEDNGTWEITYGNKIIYRAKADLTVIARWSPEDKILFWINERPVNKVIGPEDVIYCKIEDSRGVTVFEGFGRCVINLERVTMEHAGVWMVKVGLPGRVLTEDHALYVRVTEADPKPLVKTHVEKNRPSVLLSCSVASEREVKACKFRDPSGRVLLASQGVGEDRYSFHGVGVSLESDVRSHECGLRMTNPLTTDLGLWRCAMDTEDETYYGFLTVLCPWAMQDPVVAASVVSEPTLTADAELVDGVEGGGGTLSCSVQSAIRYCYFRAQNGTVFNVGPGTSGNGPEYVGGGFEAGECGVRLPSLRVNDTGRWSCHVGFPEGSLPEQRAQIQLLVQEVMTVTQYRRGSELTVEGIVHGAPPLDYCRFVRIDGAGFTWENLPSGYEIKHTYHSRGQCLLVVHQPNMLDNHPWTVVARVRGQDVEVSGVTRHTIEMPAPQPPGHSSNFAMLWILVIMICLSIFFLGLLVGPKKNRKWTYSRASTLSTRFRSSFRASLRKQPLPPTVESAAAARGTAMPA